jgi:hypothetical protein
MKQKCEKPSCFKPEENVVYPLCVGNGSEQCKNCQLWADYSDSYYAGLEG